MDVGLSTTRREVLAGVTAGTAGSLAGCLEGLWSRAENPGPDQVSLTIKSVPADDDVIAAKISNQLRENFQAAGINASFEPIARAELFRDVLIEGEYDVFVARHPGLDEYDALRGLLHSRYVSERGWQNPFHFSDVTADELLESQLLAEETEREELLVELFDHLVETVPYTTVAFPKQIGASRADLDVADPPSEALDYVDMLSRDLANRSRAEPLRVGVFGEQLTERLNPIVVDRNPIPGLLDLVYDPLARTVDDEDVPWLARDVDWETGGRLDATVTLREDLTWHDGSSLDADDVVFTYQFLGDTSLDASESPIPAPRYRDQQMLVEEVTATDARTIEFSFVTPNRSIANRAFRIPLLPAHIWEPRSELVTDRQTEALVDDNEDPIGSGLLAVADVTVDGEAELVPFEDHPFHDSEADRPSLLEDFPQFDGITFQISPNAGAVVEALADGDIDITGCSLPPDQTNAILEDPNISVLTGSTDEFYMIGYNSHHPELGNPHFRRILSRLIDREHAVRELFTGFAAPATAPQPLFGIEDTDREAEREPSLTAFPGTDGEVNPERARSLFEDEGYQYENGALLR